MTETLMFVLVIGSSILFRLGGWVWKGYRRYCLPALWLGVGILLQANILELLTATFLSSASLHLGYGETKPYWWKFIVGCLFVVPTLILGYTLWQIIVPVLWIIMFRFSNWGKIADEFSWGIVELITGAGLGIIWYRVFI